MKYKLRGPILTTLAFGLIVPAVAQWTVTRLQPPVSQYSRGFGVSDDQQVGRVALASDHASLWSGTAKSWVDLNPVGSAQSEANGVSGGQQVGYAFIGGQIRASLLSGTAASWVDLSPAGSTGSRAWGVSGGQQVGSAGVGGQLRASMWSGTAASWVDL
ncbi:MAG: hypothetical protein ABIV13_03830, partial [Fimbriimonadales bacterium]